MMQFADLFAGIGGFHFAMTRLGAQCVFASEWDAKARMTYEANFDPAGHGFAFAGDITKVDAESIPDFDVLCGGFPCQPWSVAGTQAGFSHEQGDLFFDIVRILKAKTPPAIILENVRNLQAHADGRSFDGFTDALLAAGYHVVHGVLDASTHGDLPQHRERLYIVGFRDRAQTERFVFPIPRRRTTRLFGDVIRLDVRQADRYYLTDGPTAEAILSHPLERGVVYQWRRTHLRENRSGLCPTLTANMGLGGHNVPLVLDDYGVRKLTPRECFRLQGFPWAYQFPINLVDGALYKQAGNSVAIPVVERIGRNVIDVLGGARLRRPDDGEREEVA